MNKWPMVPLGEVLQLQRRWVKLDPLVTYEEIGIRCFGNGIFHKTPIDGGILGNKRVLRIEPGDLVFNNVFAWEGAVAVASKAEAGKIGSHRFVTYTVDPYRCSADYLRWFFKSEPGMNVLRRVSPGSAGRNRTMSLEQLPKQAIPLPPLREQNKLVEYLDALQAKTDEVKHLFSAIDEGMASLVSSVHVKLSEDNILKMGDLIELSEDKVPVVPGEEYPQVGIRGFGGGLFERGITSASDTTYKSFNRLFTGALVLSQVKGWEGAIAVCPQNFSGLLASPEYRTFRCQEVRISPEYLAAITPTPWFWRQLQGLTRGVGARRERIRPETFLKMQIPMPTLEQQVEGLKVFAKLNQVHMLREMLPNEMCVLLPSVLNEVFDGDIP